MTTRVRLPEGSRAAGYPELQELEQEAWDCPSPPGRLGLLSRSQLEEWSLEALCQRLGLRFCCRLRRLEVTVCGFVEGALLVRLSFAES